MYGTTLPIETGESTDGEIKFTFPFGLYESMQKVPVHLLKKSKINISLT
jgi:hypothetical protein